METFLTPVESPSGLMMKIAYFFSRQQFGKVLTPLKVYSARLPAAFGMFMGKVSRLDRKLVLSGEMIHLVRQQVARINSCLFCVDIGHWSAMKASLNEAKLLSLDQYATNPLFTPGERAALDYVTELTRDKKVNPATFKKVSSFYSEREVCEMVWLVASEHLYNLSNIGLNIHSDQLCDLRRKPH